VRPALLLNVYATAEYFRAEHKKGSRPARKVSDRFDSIYQSLVHEPLGEQMEVAFNLLKGGSKKTYVLEVGLFTLLAMTMENPLELWDMNKVDPSDIDRSKTNNSFASSTLPFNGDIDIRFNDVHTCACAAESVHRGDPDSLLLARIGSADLDLELLDGGCNGTGSLLTLCVGDESQCK
jgi:hypothetical protein